MLKPYFLNLVFWPQSHMISVLTTKLNFIPKYLLIFISYFYSFLQVIAIIASRDCIKYGNLSKATNGFSVDLGVICFLSHPYFAMILLRKLHINEQGIDPSESLTVSSMV